MLIFLGQGHLKGESGSTCKTGELSGELTRCKVEIWLLTITSFNSAPLNANLGIYLDGRVPSSRLK